ncbi:hypothetical protein [Streptomyces massasporeus]|uniref:hypothetical protein n=1 Tax=Streptomyces massasporeus TaxID=67324 RepID=UPI0036AB5A89
MGALTGFDSAGSACIVHSDSARGLLRHDLPGHPAGKRKGRNPSVASIYRALAEHAKREVYPKAVEQAHADFAALQVGEVPGPAPQSLIAHHADHRELLVIPP